jgi:hypothetical protein
MGRGAVEAKRVGLGSVATFIGQGEGKGSVDGPIGHQWQGKRWRRQRFQLETKEKG